MLWVNSTANSYGVIVSSTNSIGNKLQKFLEVFVQGVDTASASMVGQNLGARKIERAGKTTIYTLGCTLVCATVTSLLCLFCPKVIFGLFTKDPLVLDLGVTFLRIFILHFFVSAVIGAFRPLQFSARFRRAGICDRYPGRRCLQDWSQPDLCQSLPDGLSGLVVGRRLFADTSMSDLYRLLLQREVENPKTADIRFLGNDQAVNAGSANEPPFLNRSRFRLT